MDSGASRFCELPDKPWNLRPEDLNATQLEAAARQGRVLMTAVPEARLSRELCLVFVSQNGSNLRFVPAGARGAAFDREAVMMDAWAFGYLDEEEKTGPLLLEAIASSRCFDVAMLGEEWAVPRALLTGAVIAAAEGKFGAAEVNRWVSKRKD